MRSRMLITACAVGALLAGAAPSGAADTSGRVEQQLYYQFTDFSDGWEEGVVIARTFISESSTGTTVTPTVETRASGWWITCDEFTCEGQTFPDQLVSSTALQTDPLGNSVRLVTSLTPTAGAPVAFDLTFEKPSALFPGGCGWMPGCANAWTAGDGTVGATISTSLNRFDYRSIAGVFAGEPVGSAPWQNSVFSQPLIVGVTLP